MDRVVLENKHKFVYYDNKSIKELRTLNKGYLPKINSESPMVVYIKTSGIPARVNVNSTLSRDIIKMFHENYFQLLIFSEMMNTISKNIDNVELNNRLKKVFRLCSCISREKIKDIKTLNKLLADSKKKYANTYYEYLRHGQVNFSGNISISFALVDYLIPAVKEALELKEHFCILLELNENISLYNCMALNNYMTSRDNADLSINVLLSNDTKLEFYCASNGELVESIHDYVDTDFRNVKTRVYKK